jgi:hypothetical protein
VAVIAKTVEKLRTYGDTGCHVVTWAALTQTGSDTGDPYECPGAADRSVQVQGTLGTGGTVVIEGSNDGTNYVTLTDPQGNALSINAIGRIEAISELTRWIRPRVTAGDVATSLTVILLARRGV